MSDDSADYLPSNLSLPNYVPLQRGLISRYESLFKDDSEFNAMEQFSNIKKNCEDYINFILAHEALNFDEDLLKDFLFAFNSLEESKSEITKFKKIQQHPKIREFAAREEQECKLETLDFYHENEREEFPKIIKTEHANLKVELMDEYKVYLRNLIFVIKNPEEPIPDEVEDDELAVSGGKVSLRDPLTLEYFQEPMKSLTCNHTYESSSIRENLYSQVNPIKVCPISGCDYPISENRLVPDKLMVIRIRSYKRREIKEDENIESVI